MLKTTSGTGMASSSSLSAPVPTVSAVQFQHSRNSYYLVDIREPEERASADGPSLPHKIVADENITMGTLLHKSKANQLPDSWKDTTSNNNNNTKRTVLLCGSGYRSSIAAKELYDHGYHNVAALSRGLVGLTNPAATIPDLLVVLGVKSNAEQLTLALTSCSVAASNGETVVLALMGDGVCTFLRKGNNKEESSPQSVRVEQVFVGEPFMPCDKLLQKFIGTGNGVVLACTSCVESRKIEFGSDLLDCVQPMQMPDLLRMLGETTKTLQFM